MSELEKATEIYDESSAALREIIGSLDATDTEVAKAQAAEKAVSDAFRKVIVHGFNGRTAFLNILVARLRGVTARIVTDPLQPVKDRLNKLINNALSELGQAAAQASQLSGIS
jgi:hypothetical protein